MGALLIGVGWAMLVGWLLVRIIRQGQAFRQQALLRRPARGLMPTVAVIVPARNEALNIAGCLAALGEQDYPAESLSLTVIDDNSTDDTAVQVQRTAGRVALMEAGPLPPGWLGKPHACWLGAMQADAEWLCFIDADVRAGPALLASAVSAAREHGIDLLSVQPLQELGSFWERLVIPAGMLMIAGSKPAAPPHAPRETDIAVNGQILLVRAAAYRGVGGHAAARADVCEDNALARRLHAGGYRVRVMPPASIWRGHACTAACRRSGKGSPRTPWTSSAAIMGPCWLPAPGCWSLGRFRWSQFGLAVVAWRGAELGAVLGCVVACLASSAAIGVQAGTLRHFRAPLSAAAAAAGRRHHGGGNRHRQHAAAPGWARPVEGADLRSFRPAAWAMNDVAPEPRASGADPEASGHPAAGRWPPSSPSASSSSISSATRCCRSWSRARSAS